MKKNLTDKLIADGKNYHAEAIGTSVYVFRDGKMTMKIMLSTPCKDKEELKRIMDFYLVEPTKFEENKNE